MSRRERRGRASVAVPMMARFGHEIDDRTVISVAEELAWDIVLTGDDMSRGAVLVAFEEDDFGRHLVAAAEMNGIGRPLQSAGTSRAFGRAMASRSAKDVARLLTCGRWRVDPAALDRIIRAPLADNQTRVFGVGHGVVSAQVVTFEVRTDGDA